MSTTQAAPRLHPSTRRVEELRRAGVSVGDAITRTAEEQQRG